MTKCSRFRVRIRCHGCRLVTAAEQARRNSQHNEWAQASHSRLVEEVQVRAQLSLSRPTVSRYLRTLPDDWHSMEDIAIQKRDLA